MAKAKRKRMSKEELNAPDEIEVALANFWDKLVKFKKPIIGAVVGLVAIAIVLWVVGASSRSSAESRAEAMRTAVAPLRGSVGEPDPSEATIPGPKPERFADEAAQVAEAKKRLAAYVGEYGSDDSMQLVSLADANLLLDSGDAAGAATAIEQWLAKYPESPAKVVGLELKARALTAKGERDAAIAAWQAVAAAATGELKADALRRAGDLQNPVLTEGGDAAKAKAAYDEALAALGDAPEDAGLLGPQGLRGDIKNRLDLLPQ
ncbi:MAG: hypothetical protein EP329_02520 [Deltaproteobacteria bacterium]|nr:MAG: hypothetical protein EP329_02520 [Deltaproteobacteria bacterium]